MCQLLFRTKLSTGGTRKKRRFRRKKTGFHTSFSIGDKFKELEKVEFFFVWSQMEDTNTDRRRRRRRKRARVTTLEEIVIHYFRNIKANSFINGNALWLLLLHHGFLFCSLINL